MTQRSPFRYFNTSPEIIRIAVMLYVRYPPSLRNVEDLLHERGIEISHETVRFWWNRFGPIFAAEIRRNRFDRMQSLPHWRWHLNEVFLKINGVTHYLWRAVDHDGEVLKALVTKRRDRKAALKSLRKTMKRHGRPHVFGTDKLRSVCAVSVPLILRLRRAHLPIRLCGVSSLGSPGRGHGEGMRCCMQAHGISASMSLAGWPFAMRMKRSRM